MKFTFLGGNIFIFGLDLGEDNKGLGGICKQPRLPSNIANTMPILGLFKGIVYMHT